MTDYALGIQPLPTDGNPDGTPYLSGASSPLPFAPRRVVSLVPALTEALFELNLGNRVAAITDDCRYPTEIIARVPRIGLSAQPDLERILAFRPDAVLADWDENRAEDIQALQQAGIAVWATAPRSARETLNRLWEIMYAFDEPSMVERVRAIEWTCDWLERLDETRTRACRVAPLLMRDGEKFVIFDASVGIGAYAHDLLRVCGGQNVFANPTPESPVSLAQVEAAQPDVILLVHDEDELASFTREDTPIFAVLDCHAARTNAVQVVESTLLFWRGTRIARAFSQVPDLLCPQAPPDEP